jgi:hypothetical protein
MNSTPSGGGGEEGWKEKEKERSLSFHLLSLILFLQSSLKI